MRLADALDSISKKAHLTKDVFSAAVTPAQELKRAGSDEAALRLAARVEEAVDAVEAVLANEEEKSVELEQTGMRGRVAAVGLEQVLDSNEPAQMRHLAERIDLISQVWGFSSRSTAWGLRLRRKERVILYMTPQSGQFLVSFALGEKAVAAAHLIPMTSEESTSVCLIPG